MINKYFILIFLFLPLHAFKDDDIDGVSNEKDLCPDTSFEDTVDINGCPENSNYWGKLTLSIGSDLNIDEDTTTDYTFFTNYHYQKWDFSIYSSQQSGYDINHNKQQSSGDLFISTGYTFEEEKLLTIVSIGTKLATGSDTISTGETDYFTRVSLSYILKDKLALLAQLGYTITGESETSSYKDPMSSSFGIGYMANYNWYTSLSYQQSESIYKNSGDYRSISFFNSYQFNELFFGTLNYSQGLDSLSYTHTISVNLGVNFE